MKFDPMRVLIGCEFSGTVRDAFLARGHEAVSCDLRAASGPHIQGDVFDAVASFQPELLIVHPPCTFLSTSGLHWIARGRIEKDGRPRAEHFKEALEFVRKLLALDVPKRCLENPVGAIGTHLEKTPHSVQPYDFGDDASKRTMLWLKNLPPLARDPEMRKAGRMVEWNGKMVERWSNQTDSGQNVQAPTKDPETRRMARAVTYPGIAKAMAEQWG